MKRRQFLSAATTLPLLTLAACEKNFPSDPTIVTGKVTDENNLPMEGVEFLFSGNARRGLSVINTFSTREISNTLGSYTLSYVIPSTTDQAELKIVGIFSISPNHSMWILQNGIYEELGNPINIQRSEYGKINTFNFQIRKK
ncbi:hypothetical protein DR864_13195 [Runella rosea]|uniref:Carboxypeptidase regulatory-like domain-containing protein n=1 Tax=Runella rosea TaxID=2259595 RepID=A0A344TJ20_9BACT|nr:hypothetical protein [Runella rosea]AXE18641.1 hypothetical protein DR864_13195 [Runella rosea]